MEYANIEYVFFMTISGGCCLFKILMLLFRKIIAQVELIKQLFKGGTIMKTKKVISLFVALVMCFAFVMPVSASENGAGLKIEAKDITDRGMIGFGTYSLSYYIINGSYAEITDAEPYDYGTEIEIPSLIKGYPVKGIRYDAFNGVDTMSSVKIPDSVESIGVRAFTECYMKEIVIPDSVTTLGSYVFDGCKALTSVKLSENIESIPKYAFRGCENIESIIIPEKVTEIGDGAFYNCPKLKSVEIPASVTAISDNAFKESNKVTIYGEKGSYAEQYAKAKFIPFVEGKLERPPQTPTPAPTPTVAPYTYTVIDGSYAEITKCNDSPITAVIPDEIDGYPVKKLGNFVFENCPFMTSVTLGSNVESVADYTFDRTLVLSNIFVPESNESFCDIDGVLFSKDKTVLVKYPAAKTENTYVFPETVTSTAFGAFSSAASITSIIISDNITSMEKECFSYCTGLESVTVGKGLKTIAPLTFFKCKALKSVAVGENVKEIGESAFSGCSSLEGIDIPQSVITLGDSAFSNCKALKSIEIPDTVTTVGVWLFQDCTALTDVKLPGSIMKISTRMFANCSSLQSIEIPEGIEYIAWLAFSKCTALESITIPSSVKNIEKEAFEYCKDFTIYGGSDSYAQSYASENNIPFVVIDMEKTEATPKPTAEPTPDLNAERTPTPLSDFEYVVSEYSGALEEGQSPYLATIFAYKGSDEVVVIPSEIEGAPVIMIMFGAFSENKTLKHVIIPNTVVEIEEKAFEYCTALQSVMIPDGDIEKIGVEAFFYCTSLSSVTLGNGLEFISAGAFGYCESLERLTVPDSVTRIENAAFTKCDNLTLYGKVGSYAQSYASENNIPFAVVDGYTIDEEKGILSGVSSETSLKTLRENLENSNIEVTKPNGEAITDENALIGTGYTVNLIDENGNVQKSVTVLVVGDVASDGRVNSRDLAVLQKHIMEISLLEGVYLSACDVRADDEVNSRDIAQLQKNILADVANGKGGLKL